MKLSESAFCSLGDISATDADFQRRDQIGLGEKITESLTFVVCAVATIAERAEALAYIEKLRDEASWMLKGSGWPADNPSRRLWQERFDKCNTAARILAEIECPA